MGSHGDWSLTRLCLLPIRGSDKEFTIERTKSFNGPLIGTPITNFADTETAQGQ